MTSPSQGRDDASDNSSDVPSPRRFLRNRPKVDTMQVEVGSPAPGLSEYSRSSTPQPYVQEQSRELLAGIGTHGDSFLSTQNIPNTRNTPKGNVQALSPQRTLTSKNTSNTFVEGSQPAPTRGIKRVGTDSYHQQPHRPKGAPSALEDVEKIKVQEAERCGANPEAHHKESEEDSDDFSQKDTDEAEGKGKQKT